MLRHVWHQGAQASMKRALPSARALDIAAGTSLLMNARGGRSAGRLVATDAVCAGSVPEPNPAGPGRAPDVGGTRECGVSTPASGVSGGRGGGAAHARKLKARGTARDPEKARRARMAGII